MSKPCVFSGIKPSGELHLGNYLGAVSQWVKNQDKYDNIFCVVDLHAITVPQDPVELWEQTQSLAARYLAAGIDPNKSTIFVQSHNPDHTQLGWILNCLTSIGQLNRMTQYKEKKDGAEFVSVGLFDYPVLMAADILLYDTNAVPVGDDQKQHVELARDIAEKFNNRYGEIFTLPEYLPPPAGARIMSLQHPENKMSKSEDDLSGTVYLADDSDTIQKKIMSAVTDSGNTIEVNPDRPAVSNLATIFMSLAEKTIDQLSDEYSGKGYKIFKQDLADLIISKLIPIQKKYREIRKSNKLGKVLAQGAAQAQKISGPKLESIKTAVGLR